MLAVAEYEPDEAAQVLAEIAGEGRVKHNQHRYETPLPIACVDVNGYGRTEHSLDKDGKCIWPGCMGRAPRLQRRADGRIRWPHQLESKERRILRRIMG